VDSQYHGRIKAMMDARQSRLIINLGHLREFDVALTRRLLDAPLELVPVLESAVKDVSPAARATP
jgi:DNA replicative helicase MCM subunit Mcm2 (Cdc46/Mcm family)